MGLLQPIDVGANRGYAGFDAAMIGINYRWRSASLTFRIIKKTADVVMQRRLVGFQSRSIVAALIDDLARNRPLAVQCIDRNNGILITPIRISGGRPDPACAGNVGRHRGWPRW